MRTSSRLILSALLASLLMGLAVNSASAGRFSVSNTKFRIAWTNVTLADPNEVVIIGCPVTLEGSFHSATIRKSTGALIGAITRGTIKTESCSGGSYMILRETLPWHLTYEAFSGTLPNILGMRTLISRYAIQLRARVIVEITCLYKYQGDPEENMTAIFARQESGNILWYALAEERGLMRFFSGSSGVCPQHLATSSSLGGVSLLGNNTLIVLRLI
jgi:hypothetical protein